MGRFITEDPAQQANNWYLYCGNNPIKYTDPSGLWFGVDDAFTGPVDEIFVIGGLWFLTKIGVDSAQDKLDSISSIINDAYDNTFNNDHGLPLKIQTFS